MCKEKFDFNEDVSDDVLADEQTDRDIIRLGSLLEAAESEGGIANPNGVQSVIVVYNIMKKLTKDMDVSVTYKINEPFKFFGSVSVTGKSLVFKNTALFNKAIKLCGNFNAYAKTDGTVKMDFSFNNLFIPKE